MEAKPFSFGNFKISFQAQIFFITSYHALSLLITTYHTLSPRLEEKLFSFDNFKISSQSPNFLSHLITPCHILPHLITPYPLGCKQNHFYFATLKLLPRLLFSYHILSCPVTPYHSLSPRLEAKLFSFGNCKISSQSPNFLSHLITPCYILSHLIPGNFKISFQARIFLSHLVTPYPVGWKQNHFNLATLKLVSRPHFFYHILSRFVTPYHTLSPRLEKNHFPFFICFYYILL